MRKIIFIIPFFLILFSVVALGVLTTSSTSILNITNSTNFVFLNDSLFNNSRQNNTLFFAPNTNRTLYLSVSTDTNLILDSATLNISGIIGRNDSTFNNTFNNQYMENSIGDTMNDWTRTIQDIYCDPANTSSSISSSGQSLQASHTAGGGATSCSAIINLSISNISDITNLSYWFGWADGGTQGNLNLDILFYNTSETAGTLREIPLGGGGANTTSYCHFDGSNLIGPNKTTRNFNLYKMLRTDCNMYNDDWYNGIYKIQFKTSLGFSGVASGPNTLWLDDVNIIFSNTSNVYAFVNDSSIKSFDQTGQYVIGGTIANLTRDLIAARTLCNSVNGFCNISVLVHSDTSGAVNITNLNITYKYNISSLYSISAINYSSLILTVDSTYNLSAFVQNLSISSSQFDISAFYLNNTASGLVTSCGIK